MLLAINLRLIPEVKPIGTVDLMTITAPELIYSTSAMTASTLEVLKKLVFSS